MLDRSALFSIQLKILLFAETYVVKRISRNRNEPASNWLDIPFRNYFVNSIDSTAVAVRNCNSIVDFRADSYVVRQMY